MSLNELYLKSTNPPQHVVGKHEMYAKIALLMFYPFQQLNDLKYYESYWKMFHNEHENTSTKKRQYSGRKGLKYFKIYKTDQH
jgi:hypothetical protein